MYLSVSKIYPPGGIFCMMTLVVVHLVWLLWLNVSQLFGLLIIRFFYFLGLIPSGFLWDILMGLSRRPLAVELLPEVWLKQHWMLAAINKCVGALYWIQCIPCHVGFASWGSYRTLCIVNDSCSPVCEGDMQMLCSHTKISPIGGPFSPAGAKRMNQAHYLLFSVSMYC